MDDIFLTRSQGQASPAARVQGCQGGDDLISGRQVLGMSAQPSFGSPSPPAAK